ncbi:radical SAM/SPASM domain-containing protein, partial [Streptococcus thermophilus]
NIIVNIVISSLNVMELPEIFDFCLSNKLKYIQLSSIFTTSKRLLTNDLDYLLYYEELLTTYQKQGIIFRTAPFLSSMVFGYSKRLRLPIPFILSSTKNRV